MASALLELGFITNQADNDRFDKYLDKYAEAIARALCQIVGVTYKCSDASESSWETRALEAEQKLREISKIATG